MITEQACTPHEYDEYCAGKYSDTEIVMNELAPQRSVQEYHEILSLFEVAFDIAEDRR